MMWHLRIILHKADNLRGNHMLGTQISACMFLLWSVNRPRPTVRLRVDLTLKLSDTCRLQDSKWNLNIVVSQNSVIKLHHPSHTKEVEKWFKYVFEFTNMCLSLSTREHRQQRAVAPGRSH